MADNFEPITTQEDFQARVNDIVQERLRREREAANKRYEGWMSPEDHQRALNEVTKAFDDFKKAHATDEQTIADLTAKTKAYETASLKSRIAHEVGLSYDWISRISGDDEESIRKDAESLKKLVGSGQPISTKSTEPSGNKADSTTASLRSVLNGIKQT